jgi:hypothetical protein
MHSDIPENLIQQALDIHKENSRLVRLAAPPRDYNFCDQWFQLQTNPEMLRLKATLGFVAGRGFIRWWAELYNATDRIREIRSIFDTDIVPNETLREFGMDRGYANFPFDPSHPNGIDPAVWQRIDDKLILLCKYLFVWTFRVAMSGDTTNYTRFLRDNPDPNVSSSNQSSTQEIKIDKLIEQKIPSDLLKEYKINKPNGTYIDSYPFIKKEVINFFLNSFPFDQDGNIARSQFLKKMPAMRFNFDDYWSSLPSLYSNVDEIRNVLEADVALDTSTGGSAASKLNALGVSSSSANANVDDLHAKLEQLINAIRVHEVNQLKARWVKIFGGLSKITKPLLGIYETSLNLQGALGTSLRRDRYV